MTVYTPNTVARLWSKVRVGRKRECWPFLGSTNTFGHGKLKLERTRIDKPTRIIAFELFYGDVPAGKQVQHTCDNPRCCNPAHLYAGTQKQNVQDMHSLGRWKLTQPNVHKGQNNKMAKLTDLQVLDIKRRIASGETNISIADDYPVTHGAISLIKRGIAWTHLSI